MRDHLCLHDADTAQLTDLRHIQDEIAHHHPRQAAHRAGGKVCIANQNHIRCAGRNNGVEGNLNQHIDKVAHRCKLRHEDHAHRKERHHEQLQRVLFYKVDRKRLSILLHCSTPLRLNTA